MEDGLANVLLLGALGLVVIVGAMWADLNANPYYQDYKRTKKQKDVDNDTSTKM